MNKVSSVAHSNIALVKYWGKRDEDLILALNNNLSVTLSELKTQTTIGFAKENYLEINGTTISSDESTYKKIYTDYFSKLKPFINDIPPLKIVSNNNFPTAAGLASSASGFAALGKCINKLFELDLSINQQSILARLGSGSASRSILGGFNAWQMGELKNGTDSHIDSIANENFWPEFQIAVCITASGSKSQSSRAGMKNTVLTSPVYQSLWLDTVEEDFLNAKTAILAKDFSTLGTISEKNALKMHDTMRTSTPSLDYWNINTHALTNAVVKAREDGIESYFTIDAGPQVKILHLKKDEEKLKKLLANYLEEDKVVINHPGVAAHHNLEDLF